MQGSHQTYREQYTPATQQPFVSHFSSGQDNIKASLSLHGSIPLSDQKGLERSCLHASESLTYVNCTHSSSEKDHLKCDCAFTALPGLPLHHPSLSMYLLLAYPSVSCLLKQCISADQCYEKTSKACF